MLTSDRARVELPGEEEIDMSGSFGQLYILSAEAARKTLVNGQPVLPEAGARPRLRVSFTSEPEKIEVLCGSKRLQVFSTAQEAKIVSTERGAGKRYLILCDDVRSPLHNYKMDETSSKFLVPLPKKPIIRIPFKFLTLKREK